MNVCIIPARGGSKRIPRKNIREFCGKPMIAHSIDTALSTGIFERVIVTTDSRDIARLAKELGAEVPFTRPEDLSNDTASTDAVLVHALEWLRQHDTLPDYACCLYATAPFVQAEYLCQGLDLLQSSGASVSFSVTSFPYPVFRGLKITEQGTLEMLWPEHRTTRSQDLPEVYHDAGQFYWVDVPRYLDSSQLYAPDAVPVIIPRHLVQDIDSEEDWKRAELMFKALRHMSNVLIIRADAGVRMGTGHVMRCIALGQAWRDAGGRVILVSCCKSEVIRQRLSDEGLELVELQAAYPEAKEDLQILLETAAESGARWIITDGYHFDLTYQQAVRASGFQLLCVDDYNHLPEYEADLLLNQNVGAETLDYRCNTDCRRLLGTRYVMVRREFRQAERRERSGPVQHVLVTMGGSDPDNATLRVMQAVARSGADDLKVKVIAGAMNPHLDSLQQLADAAAVDFELMRSVRDMPALMGWADFAVTAAGSTCWELALLGVPFTTVILADNQAGIAHMLRDKNGVACMEWADDGLVDRLTSYCNRTFSCEESQSEENAGSLVDGFGVDRILRRPAVDSGLDLYKGRLILREAVANDAADLFAWANDPETRANSFNPKPIEWDGHVRWLTHKLASDTALLLMLELDGVPCGHVRYDRDRDGVALLSFVVAPAFRGMGLGRKLVETARSRVRDRWSDAVIKAIAFADNTASAQIFVKTGFNEQPQEAIEGHACRVFLWDG